MKAYLFLLLFALTACTFPDDLLKLAKCVLSSPTVYEVLPKVIEAVKNGDYFTLLQIALTEVPKVKDEVMECMDEPILKLTCENIIFACLIHCPPRKNYPEEFESCIKKCEKSFCH